MEAPAAAGGGRTVWRKNRHCSTANGRAERNLPAGRVLRYDLDGGRRGKFHRPAGKAGPMKLDLRAVAANVRRADTETLLDRVTVYRPAMEPAALDLMEGELSRRGVSEDDIAAHAEGRAGVLVLPDGTARRCDRCERPAVWRGWGWHRLWGVLPVFPRRVNRCEGHTIS